MSMLKKIFWMVALVLIGVGVLFFMPHRSVRMDATATAQEAYIYGLQQAVFYTTRYNYTQMESSPSYVGTNRLGWLREPITAEFKDVVTPNATTLYGAGFLDLMREPVVVEIPAIKDRYWSFQSMDQYGDYYFYAGNQFTGTDAQKYIITGPGWQGVIPAEFSGIEIIKAPTNSAFMIVRIALETGTQDEVRLINGYQDNIITTPLSDWLSNGRKDVAYAGRAKVRGDYATFPGIESLVVQLVEKQTALDYFTILSLVLNDPTMTKRANSLKEVETLKRLEQIGIAQGIKFDPKKISTKLRAALERGFIAGKKKVAQAMRTGMINMNGWMLTKDMGDFGTDYLTRAAVADAGWAGPGQKSHTGALLFFDSQGRQLNGKNRYTMTFDIKNLPPVTEFWSIPIYDITGYLVDNELNRYTVNSFMYKRGEFHIDGNNLIFYIQKEKPADPNQLKNWLPAPKGDFRFVARFYGPKAPLIDGRYEMPQPTLVN